MHRTQIYLTDDQQRRIAELARDRGVPKAQVIRSILDAALDTGDAEAEARAVIEATAGLLADYPGWADWQRSVRGRNANERLESLGL